jgi:hypothetical protein
MIPILIGVSRSILSTCVAAIRAPNIKATILGLFGLDQEGDCRPTRAYLDDGGVWHAWNGKKWLIVPWQAILPQDYAHDGRSHLCEKHEQIYCFSPGSPKS